MDRVPALGLALDALESNPMVFVDAAELRRRLEATGDVSFDELDMDSLAFMELSIWLQVELGLEFTTAEIAGFGGLLGLARGISASRPEA